MREVKPATGEHYHVYNRGVDKRQIFTDQRELERFLFGMKVFNTLEQTGHLPRRHSVTMREKATNIIAYCLNPNHFHLILEQVAEKGIEKFMHKLEMGYSKYFNIKHERKGSLFQGKYQIKHIDSNEYLLHLSAYVNLNDRAHACRHRVTTGGLGKSSWNEYLGKESDGICAKDIILKQFDSPKKYAEFAESSLRDITKRKAMINDLEVSGIELI